LWGWLLNNTGSMRHIQGRVAESVDCARRAIVAKEKALGHDSPDLGGSIGNLAFYLSEAGNLEEAVRYSERAIKILEAGLGPEHPRTAVHLSNYSEILNHLGRFAEAREVAERALAIFERETESEGVFVTAALVVLGIAQLGDGLVAQAVPVLERAVKNRENNEAGTPARLAEVHFALARAVWQTDHTRARVLAVRAGDEYAQAIPSPATTRARTEIAAWLASRLPVIASCS
jgi:tetratricopeptide (TPR) repeat protein